MAVRALMVTNSLKTCPFLPVCAGVHVKTDFVSQKTGLRSAFTSPYVPLLKDNPQYSLNISKKIYGRYMHNLNHLMHAIYAK